MIPSRRWPRSGSITVWRKTRNHSPITVRPEVLIAGAALLLSVTTVLAGAWFAIRGSVVTAVPPDAVFFYKDAGEGAGAVLTAGVDTSLVNSASGNYGDVVTRVTMQIEGPGAGDPEFNYTTLLTPVFSEIAARQAAECPVAARCVVNDGQFLAIEQPRRTLDVPGGASRSEYVGFVLQSMNCAEAGRCAAFGDFESAARSLETSRILTIRFHYLLHSDGRKTAVCRIDLGQAGEKSYRPWLADHLDRKGWVQLLCNR